MLHILQREYGVSLPTSDILTNLVHIISNVTLHKLNETVSVPSSDVGMTLDQVLSVVGNWNEVRPEQKQAVPKGCVSPSIRDLKEHLLCGDLIKFTEDGVPYCERDRHLRCTYTPWPMYVTPPGGEPVFPCLQTHRMLVSFCHLNVA